MTGFLIDDLSQSQLYCDLIRSAPGGPPVTVYTRRGGPAWAEPPFPVDHWCAAYGADFPLVATDLDGVGHLLRFPAAPRRVYYVADLEWLRHARWGGRPPYHAIAAAVRDPRLEIVCRSEAHRRAVADAFNVHPVAVRPRLDAGLVAGLEG